MRRPRARWNPLPGRCVATCLVAVCLAACGGSAPSDSDGTGAVGRGLDSLPAVDLTRRPIADDRDPSRRAGAVADHVDCAHGVWQGGWSADFGPLGGGSNPDAALAAMLDDDVLGLPVDHLGAVGRDRGRVLYTYEVGGKPKIAVVVADSASAELGSEHRWEVEAFASCDPAEFDPSTDDELAMEIWQDASGTRIPTSVIVSSRGPEHCDWESVTFLTLDGVGYVRDPGRVLGTEGFVSLFDDDAELPSDAVDTGYRRDGRRLWLSSDRAIAYVVADGVVEAWPSSTEQFACA